MPEVHPDSIHKVMSFSIIFPLINRYFFVPVSDSCTEFYSKLKNIHTIFFPTVMFNFLSTKLHTHMLLCKEKFQKSLVGTKYEKL